MIYQSNNVKVNKNRVLFNDITTDFISRFNSYDFSMIFQCYYNVNQRNTKRTTSTMFLYL